LQITLGNALLATKGYAAPEPGDVFDRARQLCEKLNQSQQLNQVLVGQFLFRLLRGELERAEHLASEIRRLGEGVNDACWKYNSLTRDGVVCCWLGKFLDARDYYEIALSLSEPSFRDRATSPQDVYVSGSTASDRTGSVTFQRAAWRRRSGEGFRSPWWRSCSSAICPVWCSCKTSRKIDRYDVAC
jgi:hypothetical protein